ncbi:MAG: heparinase II/III family protein [Faecalibacterium prausnitzii]
MMAYSAAPRHHLTVWYPSVGVYAARQGSWVLGAKFGSNGDSHNHNDTGSITVYKDGRPFLIDIGVESYTQKTFSPSGMKFGPCRAHGTICLPLTVCSNCPARIRRPGGVHR